MFNEIKQKIKERKGSSTIDFVISLLIFIILFSFVFDFFFIAYRQHQVSRLTTDVTRVVALQSGVLPKAPRNYPGGEMNYYAIDDLDTGILRYMEDLGITNYKVTISMQDRNSNSSPVKSFVLSSSSSGYNTDYRGEITVTIEYNFKRGIWRNLFPIADGHRVVTRTGYGEYKHDYNSWKGER